MLSSTLITKPGSLVNIGRDPRFVGFLKGVYNKSPLASKYASSCDPDHFDMHANTKSPFLICPAKTFILTAFRSILGTSEIVPIQLESIRICDTNASFILGKPRKVRHVGPQ